MSSMSEEMQRAAITAALNNGESFDDIKKRYPELKRVADAMEKEKTKKTKARPRGSGSTVSLFDLKRPRF